MGGWRFIEIEDAATASFSDEEVARLRAYLLKGGFLWSDDFWGPDALASFESELARILPPQEYPVRDIQSDRSRFIRPTSTGKTPASLARIAAALGTRGGAGRVRAADRARTR